MVAWCCVAVVMDVLRGPLSGNAGVAEAGLRAVANLAANNVDIKRLLGFLGACEGERLSVLFADLLIDLHTHSPFFL